MCDHPPLPPWSSVDRPGHLPHIHPHRLHPHRPVWRKERLSDPRRGRGWALVGWGGPSSAAFRTSIRPFPLLCRNTQCVQCHYRGRTGGHERDAEPEANERTAAEGCKVVKSTRTLLVQQQGDHQQQPMTTAAAASALASSFRQCRRGGDNVIYI